MVACGGLPDPGGGTGRASPARQCLRQVYAAASGEIIKAEGEECGTGVRCSSFYLAIAGDDGRGYFYVHLNNDTPGRPNGCDGTAGYQGAFSERLVRELEARGSLRGVRVRRGEAIGFVGSSGNAACGQDQLHFEIWNDHDWGSTGKTNPYPELRAAYDQGRAWDAHGPVESVPSSRDAGEDRVATAVRLSQQAFEQADTVIIAPGNVYPEALLGGPLAALVGGPVLLTWADPADALPEATSAEIRRLGATRAILIGDPGRLPAATEDELVREAGLAADQVERIGGADRYEVSRNVAEAMAERGGDMSRPLLALGEHEVPDRGWPDALGASAVAAAQRVPILLTRADDLPPPMVLFLREHAPTEVRVVGGSSAIARQVEDLIRDDLGISTRRLAGPNRYQTGIALAGEVISSLDGAFVLHVATGRSFPDALTAGPSLASRGALLLLVDGQDPAASPSVHDWAEANREQITSIHAVGGPRAVGNDVLEELSHRAAKPATSSDG